MRGDRVRAEGALRFAWRTLWRCLPLFWAGLAGVAAVWVLVELLVIRGMSLGRAWWWFWHVTYFYLASFPEIMLAQVALDRRDGTPPSLKASIRGFHVAGAWFAVKMLYLLAVIAGVALLIIPGIHLAVRFQFAPLFLLDGVRSPIEALRASSRMTQGRRSGIFGFDLVLLLVNAIGAALLGIGLLVTIPLSLLALAHRFRGYGRIGHG